MVNLKRQVGNILSSIYTNGFIISTLTYQYKVHDITKLYNCVIHFSQLFPFFTLKIGPYLVNLFQQVGFILNFS
jgi:hypothetical protein